MESTATPSATPGFDRHWLPWTFQWGFRGVRDTRGFSVARLGEVGATVQQIIGNGLLLAAAPELRDASQHLYNAIQDYLNVPDSELPADLVAAFNEMEAAWHKADGTTPEDHE